jgi:hypothetical protein
VHGDVRDAQTVDDALRGMSTVCHLAAMVGLGADATVAALESLVGPGAAAGPAEPGTLRAYNVGSGTPRTVGQPASARAAVPFAQGVLEFAAAPAGRVPA